MRPSSGSTNGGLPSSAAAQRVLAAIIVDQQATLDDLTSVAAAFGGELRRRWPAITDEALARLFSRAVHVSLK